MSIFGLNLCPKCSRPRQEHPMYGSRQRGEDRSVPICGKEKPAKIRVVHDYYGCDTGCCGLVIYVDLEDGDSLKVGGFEFMHDIEDMVESANSLAKELGGIPVDASDAKVARWC